MLCLVSTFLLTIGSLKFPKKIPALSGIINMLSLRVFFPIGLGYRSTAIPNRAAMDTLLILFFVIVCIIIISIIVFPELVKKTDEERTKKIISHYNQLSPEGQRQVNELMKRLLEDQKKEEKQFQGTRGNMFKQVKFGAKILFAALIWGIAALIAFTAIKIVLNFLQQLFPNMGDFWNMPAGILIAFAVIFLVVLVTLIALKSTGVLKIAPQRMENFQRKYLPLALVSGFVGIGILHGIALVLPGGAIPQIMSYGLATVNILGIISYFVMAAGREKLDSVTIFTTRS